MNDNPTIKFHTTPPFLVINSAAGKPLVTIRAGDGAIEYGEGYTPDEAARIFWDALSRFEPTRELRQQLAAAEAERDKAQADAHDQRWQHAEEMRRSARAEAERDRAVKDAERYRWLRQVDYTTTKRSGPVVWHTFADGEPAAPYTGRGFDLDGAVDAAMGNAAIAAAAGDAGGEHG